MIYIIYPTDESTEFLLEIPKRIKGVFGEKSVQLLRIYPNEESYSEAIGEIEAIPEKSIILFMGHGQEDKLWGAESELFLKRPLVTKVQSKIFANKYLFLLACDSNKYLKGTFSFSKVISSIGFGSLPTEMTEVQNSKRLTAQGVNERVISMYKSALIELVGLSFCDMIGKQQSFSQLSSNFMLRLNKMIYQVILEDKTGKDTRVLADLLFQMKTEIIFI